MKHMTLSDELLWRGFIHQTTLSDIKKLDTQKWTFYHGYDASSDSLTVGNLAAVMMDKVFMRHGHRAILLAGGATSLIGDPGGKDAERPLQPENVVEDNVAAVRRQVEGLLGNNATMVNNLDWFHRMNVLDFLRDVGKHFSMTPLVQRDYIARRIGPSGAGITYTEFSYTLLQGYDYLELQRKYGVNLQLAGSDQWGNSLSGVDLVRRVTGKEVHVVTCPLVINKSTGRKFGKSEDGAIWLDPQKTSVFAFYQFWLNSSDEDVGDYLKIFTELDKPSVDATLAAFKKDRGARSAQYVLAYEVTKLVHGTQEADTAVKITKVLFGSEDFLGLSDNEKKALTKELPTVKAKGGFVHTLVSASIAMSNSEALRLIKSGAISLNGKKVSDASEVSFVKGHNLLKRGKNSFTIVLG